MSAALSAEATGLLQSTASAEAVGIAAAGRLRGRPFAAAGRLQAVPGTAVSSDCGNSLP